MDAILMIFPERRHVPPYNLAAQKHSLEIDIDDRVPIFFRVVKGGTANGAACVVHQHVNVFPFSQRLRNRALYIALAAHIRLNRVRFGARLLDQFHGFAGLVQKNVSHNQSAARPGQANADSLAQAAAASGHERGLAV
jgi:hypothetical protein